MEIFLIKWKFKNPQYIQIWWETVKILPRKKFITLFILIYFLDPSICVKKLKEIKEKGKKMKKRSNLNPNSAELSKQ